MEIVALLKAALVAFPKFVDTLGELKSAVDGLRDARISEEVQKLKEEVAIALQRIEDENDPNRVSTHMRRLNDAISR